MPAKPLGRERKRLAFFVIAIGLGTFFLPMVILNPPLLDRAQLIGLRDDHQVIKTILPRILLEERFYAFSTASSSSKVAAVVKLSTPKTTSASARFPCDGLGLGIQLHRTRSAR